MSFGVRDARRGCPPSTSRASTIATERGRAGPSPVREVGETDLGDETGQRQNALRDLVDLRVIAANWRAMTPHAIVL
jgi:hypothetical protein